MGGHEWPWTALDSPGRHGLSWRPWVVLDEPGWLWKSVKDPSYPLVTIGGPAWLWEALGIPG